MCCFEELLEPIKSGEHEAKQLLRENGYRVKDVSNDSRYFKKDIDLLVSDEEDTYSIEVKWDNVIAKSGNLFIEFYCSHSADLKGWFSFCQADYLMYGDAVNGIFYIYRVNELKEFIENNKEAFQVRAVKEVTSCNAYESKGYLVPLSAVESLLVNKARINGGNEK